MPSMQARARVVRLGRSDLLIHRHAFRKLEERRLRVKLSLRWNDLDWGVSGRHSALNLGGRNAPNSGRSVLPPHFSEADAFLAWTMNFSVVQRASPVVPSA